MKTLHWYLTRQVTASLAVALLVFTFVLLLGHVLKEILGLLVNGQVGLGIVFKIVLLLIPFVLEYALPIGLLTAILLVFGRLSADQEFTAMRASGISLVGLVSPILLLSLALCVVSALLNMQVAPLCRLAYRSMIWEAGLERITSVMQEKTFIKSFPRHIVYIGDIDSTGTNLSEVLIYELNDKGTLEGYIRATEGQLVVGEENDTLHVRLMDTWTVSMQGEWENPFYAGEVLLGPIHSPSNRARKPSLKDMNIFQLLAELHDLENRLGEPIWTKAANRKQMQSALTEWKLKKRDLTLPVKVHIHGQIASSFACLGFALVGIPLGIRAHRRETTFGIALALILVIVYYGFFIFGQAMEARPEWSPHLIFWIPNLIFQVVGAVLLRRADRSA